MGSSEIDTAYLRRCIKTLEHALAALHAQRGSEDDILYDIYRAACVKEFELVLEQSGKLLKKRLRPWFASNRQADRLAFKDVFRYAAKHGLIPTDSCERWLEYRDNRNDTAHDYGKGFAEATLKLLPRFVDDALTPGGRNRGEKTMAEPPAGLEAAGKLHLSARHRASIEALVSKHLPGVDVWAYGSRVDGPEP